MIATEPPPVSPCHAAQLSVRRRYQRLAWRVCVATDDHVVKYPVATSRQPGTRGASVHHGTQGQQPMLCRVLCFVP